MKSRFSLREPSAGLTMNNPSGLCESRGKRYLSREGTENAFGNKEGGEGYGSEISRKQNGRQGSRRFQEGESGSSLREGKTDGSFFMWARLLFLLKQSDWHRFLARAAARRRAARRARGCRQQRTWRHRFQPEDGGRGRGSGDCVCRGDLPEPFKLTRMDRVFRMFATEKEAVEALAALRIHDDRRQAQTEH